MILRPLLDAMAIREGFYVPHSRPQRNNNPLDLKYGPEAIRFGATHGDPRFAVFPDLATGWVAAARWLKVPAKFKAVGDDPHGELVGGYLGATLSQVIHRFAPPNENNTSAYLDFVCIATGLTPFTLLTPDLLIPPGGTNAQPPAPHIV